MKKNSFNSAKVKYYLDKNQNFVIENYNHSKTFSNFFPGIAGLMGIPMWVFYVNRGQCITSFGIEAKDKAIMEFYPANKSYRLTSLQGFRTFIKVSTKGSKKKNYWEPFQKHLIGTNFNKETKLLMSSYDLTLVEINHDLGLAVEVNYFTLPEEPYPALVRKIKISNIGKKACDIEVVDGLPLIVPYGLKDWLAKHLSRTVEAWIQVQNLEKKAPYYQLNVEVSDKPEVTDIEEGNFFFSFDEYSNNGKLLQPIVETACVFDKANDFIFPEIFISKNFKIPKVQQTTNRTPSAMSYTTFGLNPKGNKEIISLFGYAYNQDQLNEIVDEVTKENFIHKKAEVNKDIINKICNFTKTKSSSKEFNLYSSNTFLDNIIRGGLPISIKTSEGNVVFNVYNRKHGDLERDYNYFVVSPTFYSQGNGNYRDVNQNRRNDIWFNADVKDDHLINFLNLIQADGYNPLVVKGTTFSINEYDKVSNILNKSIDEDAREKVAEFLKNDFRPGELLEYISQNDIKLTVCQADFLGMILEICRKQELADHGEGFWSDHWTYNMDLIESYLSFYPEDLKHLLFDKKVFNFYQNSHYILPRDQRYVLTEKGVRQYQSVAERHDFPKDVEDSNKLKIKYGEGAVYQTNLIVKILCIISNKIASLDPSGIGVEMEADKPNWYDSLNGLPGLLGSAISETIEIKRLSLFLLESIKKLSLDDDYKVSVFEELTTFLLGLSNLLSLEINSLAYWNKSNDNKELYRKRVREGIDGTEKEVLVSEIKNFLKLVIKKTNNSIKLAKDKEGFLHTYFYHKVEEYDILDVSKNKSTTLVKPTKFKIHFLPLFLEGYVHAIRVEDKKENALDIYNHVCKSTLYDKKLKMFKVNSDLSDESDEIGRTRVFPRGWLENESVWLHMEYKFMLELLRTGLYKEFYDNYKNILVPFLKPEVYGRSITENSSFLVSSAHEDKSLHGQGFVARLSGSTAEFLHIWLFMNIGTAPFYLDAKKKLVFSLKPILAGSLFTRKRSKIEYLDSSNKWKKVSLPENIYAFIFLGSILVVYHNPKLRNTFGEDKVKIKEIFLTYPNRKSTISISSEAITAPYSEDIRSRKVERIDVYFA